MSVLTGFFEIKNNFSKLLELAEDIPNKEMDVKKLDSPIAKEIDTEEYFSTYDERLKQTPAQDSERGKWEENRGESKFIPYDNEIKAILTQYGLDGIVYKDAIPDFSECAEETVEIEDMSDIRSKNFQQCDEKCAEQWNLEGRDGKFDWTPRDVAEWRKENGYTWHERNDMKTCDLVPTEINDFFGHLGGVSECKKRDAETGGDEFDE